MSKFLATAFDGDPSQTSNNVVFNFIVSNPTYAPSSKLIKISPPAHKPTLKQLQLPAPKSRPKEVPASFFPSRSLKKKLVQDHSKYYEPQLPPPPPTPRVCLKLQDSHQIIEPMNIPYGDGDKGSKGLKITVAAKRQVVEAEGGKDRVKIILRFGVVRPKTAPRCVRANLRVELPDEPQVPEYFPVGDVPVRPIDHKMVLTKGGGGGGKIGYGPLGLDGHGERAVSDEWVEQRGVMTVTGEHATRGFLWQLEESDIRSGLISHEFSMGFNILPKVMVHFTLGCDYRGNWDFFRDSSFPERKAEVDFHLE